MGVAPPPVGVSSPLPRERPALTVVPVVCTVVKKDEVLQLRVDAATKQGRGPKAGRSASRRHTLYLGGAPGEGIFLFKKKIYIYINKYIIKSKSLPTSAYKRSIAK